MSNNRNRVFIGRLNPEARARDLERFFRDKGFSRLKDINIKLGYAFVEFEDKRDADDAVYELNKKEFYGSRITVEHATGTPKEDLPRSRDRDRDRGDRTRDRGAAYRDDRGQRGGGYGRSRPYNTEWRVIVTNLSSRVGWQDLKDYFRAAGEVTFTKANKEKVGEGVVEFRSYKIMKKAIEKFDGTEFFNRTIKLIDDSPGPPRSKSRSRSRTRSRSRRRTRSRSASAKREASKSKSRSRSPQRDQREKSPSRSKSPVNRKSKSPANRRSRSASRDRDDNPDD